MVQKKVQDSILTRIYVDKNKTAGIRYPSTVLPYSSGDPIRDDVKGIYKEYVKAFQKGVYDYIKETEDPVTGKVVPRRYFSGGFHATDFSQVVFKTTQDPHTLQLGQGAFWGISVRLAGVNPAQDAAMFSAPLGLEHSRALLDAYLADPRSRHLYGTLRKLGVDPVFLQEIFPLVGDKENIGLVGDVTRIVERISNDRGKGLVSPDTSNVFKADKDILQLLLLAAQERPSEYPLARVAAGFVSGNDRLSDEIGVNQYGSHEHAEINLILSILEKEAVNVRPKWQGKYRKLLQHMRKFVKKEKLDTERGLFLLRKALKWSDHPFKKGIFYVTLMPCSACQKVLKELGLKKVVYSDIHPDLDVAEKWRRQSEQLSLDGGVPIIHVDMLADEVQPNRLFNAIVARSPEGHSRFQREYLRIVEGREDAVELIDKWLSEHKSRLVDIIAFFGNVMPDDAPVLFDTLFGRFVDAENLKVAFERYRHTEGFTSYLAAIHRVHHNTDVEQVIMEGMKNDFAEAMSRREGGINLNSDNVNLVMRHDAGEIEFQLRPGMAEQSQAISGFVPVIFNIRPMTDLKMFLGLKEEEPLQLFGAATSESVFMGA